MTRRQNCKSKAPAAEKPVRGNEERIRSLAYERRKRFSGRLLVPLSGCRRSKLSALRDASSQDHLIGQQRFRDGETKGLGGLEVIRSWSAPPTSTRTDFTILIRSRLACATCTSVS